MDVRVDQVTLAQRQSVGNQNKFLNSPMMMLKKSQPYAEMACSSQMMVTGGVSGGGVLSFGDVKFGTILALKVSPKVSPQGRYLHQRDSSKKEVSTTSTTQFHCPMLKPSNYSLWEIRMQIILEANGLWEMIETLETTKVDNKKDKTAITFLYQALPEEQWIQITKHKTVKAICDALKTRHIGEQRVQQERLQTLKSDFEMLHMKEDETTNNFTGKLTTLVNKADCLGHTIEDFVVVRKFLNVVPDKFLQIVASIEQYSNLDEMSVDKATED
nr:zinc finger, CCHC-type [Tanacetum cinerariifolium]